MKIEELISGKNDHDEARSLSPLKIVEKFFRSAIFSFSS